MLFAPGVLPAFVGDRADLFSNRSVPVEDIWGSGREDRLRSHLRELTSPVQRLQTLENWLLEVLARPMETRHFSLHPAVEFALRRFASSSTIAGVADLARKAGWSERHFSQVFREQVGFGPKVWWRLQRFQDALRQLYAGMEMPLAELAVDCGFYDQAHFANEFRSFSGIDVTTYNANRHQLWTNHTPA